MPPSGTISRYRRYCFHILTFLKIRHVYVRDGFTTNDTVCVHDNLGKDGKGNLKCAEDRKIAVVTDQRGYEEVEFDGILGIGRLPPDSSYTNQTQLVAGLVNDTTAYGISHHSVYLDMTHRKLHLGEEDEKSYKNSSLKGFITFKNQFEDTDDGQWAVRVEDVAYGKAYNNTSLDDIYSDLAVIDTIFPGLYIPSRVWPKFKSLLQNVSGLNCSLPDHILGQDYEHCFVNRPCAEVSNLEDIYLYFNATTDVLYNYTEWFLSYAKSDYASDTIFTDLDGTTHKYCKISVYG